MAILIHKDMEIVYKNKIYKPKEEFLVENNFDIKCFIALGAEIKDNG